MQTVKIYQSIPCILQNPSHMAPGHTCMGVIHFSPQHQVAIIAEIGGGGGGGGSQGNLFVHPHEKRTS